MSYLQALPPLYSMTIRVCAFIRGSLLLISSAFLGALFDWEPQYAYRRKVWRKSMPILGLTFSINIVKQQRHHGTKATAEQCQATDHYPCHHWL